MLREFIRLLQENYNKNEIYVSAILFNEVFIVKFKKYFFFRRALLERYWLRSIHSKYCRMCIQKRWLSNIMKTLLVKTSHTYILLVKQLNFKMTERRIIFLIFFSKWSNKRIAIIRKVTINNFFGGIRKWKNRINKGDITLFLSFHEKWSCGKDKPCKSDNGSIWKCKNNF